MSVGNAPNFGKAVSEETLVTISEDLASNTSLNVEDGSEITRNDISVDYGSELNQSYSEMRVKYKVIPTVPILAVASIVLVVIGALFFSFSARRIKTTADQGYASHFGNYALLSLSALFLAVGIIFAFPCVAVLIEKLRKPRNK